MMRSGFTPDVDHEGDHVAPGCTQQTRMPWFFVSARSTLAMPVTPNFAAQYAVECGYAPSPAIELMKKISPCLRCSIAGRNACVTRNALRRLTEIISSNWPIVVSANGAIVNAP